MANVTEDATYDDGVYQLETTDPVQGGPSGVDNAPHINLANRTGWLKAAVDAIDAFLATLGSAATKTAGTAAGDVLLIDGTGKLPAVDGSQLTNVAGGLGYGQAWTDVHSARALSTIYQNTTSKPIMVSIDAALSDSPAGSVTGKVGAASPPVTTVGVIANSQTNPLTGFLSFVVPPGHYYRLIYSGGVTLGTWAELQ